MAAEILLKIKKWDDYTSILLNGFRAMSSIDTLLLLITKTGNGVVYVLTAVAIGVFVPEYFASFMISAVTAFAIGLLAHFHIKRWVRRLRPYEAHPKIRVDFKPIERFSFPSGHTLHAFLMVTLLASFFPMMVIPLYLWAALVGISRIYLGVHYLSDVFAGALLGIVSGWLGLGVGI